MTTPDRWTRMVERDYQRNHINDGVCGQTWVKETSSLLQREHQAVVRKVKGMEWHNPKTEYQRGQADIVKEILAWLQRRGR